MKRTLYDAMRGLAGEISRISQAEPALQQLLQLPSVQACRIRSIDLGRGVVTCELQCPEALFYQVLGEKSGFPIENDAQLMQLLEDLAKTKAAYDKVADALEQVQATGYGVVMPTAEEMELQPPEIVRKGGSYAVRIKASAPSISSAARSTTLSPTDCRPSCATCRRRPATNSNPPSPASSTTAAGG